MHCAKVTMATRKTAHGLMPMILDVGLPSAGKGFQCEEPGLHKQVQNYTIEDLQFLDSLPQRFFF